MQVEAIREGATLDAMVAGPSDGADGAFGAALESELQRDAPDVRRDDEPGRAADRAAEKAAEKTPDDAPEETPVDESLAARVAQTPVAALARELLADAPEASTADPPTGPTDLAGAGPSTEPGRAPIGASAGAPPDTAPRMTASLPVEAGAMDGRSSGPATAALPASAAATAQDAARSGSGEAASDEPAAVEADALRATLQPASPASRSAERQERRSAAEERGTRSVGETPTAAAESAHGADSRRHTPEPAPDVNPVRTAPESPAATTPGPATAAGPQPTAPPATQVEGPATTAPRRVEQLPEHIRLLASRGGGTARLRLHPAELGEVEITVRLRGSSVDVAIRAVEPAAQLAVHASREQLVDALGSREIRVGSFDVSGHDAGNAAGGNPFRDAPRRDFEDGPGSGRGGAAPGARSTSDALTSPVRAEQVIRAAAHANARIDVRI